MSVGMKIYHTRFWHWGVSLRTYDSGFLLTIRLGKRQLVIGKKVRYFSKLCA